MVEVQAQRRADAWLSFLGHSLGMACFFSGSRRRNLAVGGPGTLSLTRPVLQITVRIPTCPANISLPRGVKYYITKCNTMISQERPKKKGTKFTLFSYIFFLKYTHILTLHRALQIV